MYFEAYQILEIWVVDETIIHRRFTVLYNLLAAFKLGGSLKILIGEREIERLVNCANMF